MSLNIPILYEQLRQSWLRSVRAGNRAPKTVKLYGTAAGQLIDFLTAKHPTVPPSGLTREHMEDFLVAYSEGRSASTVSLAYRSLQQWFKWMVDEGELDADPTARMEAPMIPEKPVPIISDEDLRALLATCTGRSMVDRRDQALFRFFIDTGCRLAEVTGLGVADVDLTGQTAQVLGKGRRERTVPFGVRTADALDRYLRVRAADRLSDDPALWLGEKGKGPLGSSGIYQVIRRRAKQAGLAPIHPHQFRHTAAHKWMLNGGGESDLMQISGWKSRSMLTRYGASAASVRAVAAHHRLAIGDNL